MKGKYLLPFFPKDMVNCHQPTILQKSDIGLKGVFHSRRIGQGRTVLNSRKKPEHV